MLINEVTQGTKVVLYVMIGSKSLEFETEAVEGMKIPKCGLVVMPIKKEEKMLNFNVGGIICQALIYNEEDSKPYLWKEIKISKLQRKDKIYHVLLCSKNVQAINRRETYRVWLGFDGVAQIGANKATYDVIVKDISATGISFIARKNIDVMEGIPIHIHFTDEKKEATFSMTGLLVRKEEVEDGKTLFGCRLNSDSPLVRRYVNEKQIEQARSVGNLDKRMENGTVKLEKNKKNN